MDKPHFDSNPFNDEVINSTSAYQKVWNYLLGIGEEPEFERKLRKLRKKYNLPPEGVSDVFKGSSKAANLDSVELPAEIVDQAAFEDEIQEWTKELGLSWFWVQTLAFKVAYNRWFSFWSFGSLVHVDELNRYRKDIDDEYPLAIMFSPYATRNDLIDFVEKTYMSHIKPMQEKYADPKVRIGKVRERNDEKIKRDMYIHSHRDKSGKEIMKLVADNYGEILDYTYIRKIISDEEKKRK